jgi:hypothetical protein
MKTSARTGDEILWPEFGALVGVELPGPVGGAAALAPEKGAVLKTMTPRPVSVKTLVEVGFLTVQAATEP